MKKLLNIFFLLFATVTHARNYYVSNAGSDGAAGTSKRASWATISKVNTFFSGLSVGDSVLFKRGDTFRGSFLIARSGSSGNPIVIGAYGRGPKPLFLGSVDKSSTSDWTNAGTNLWTNTGAPITTDAGNIIFNKEASCGIKLMSASPNFTTQGQFWYDYTNHLVMMYSVGNPGTFYTHIEVASDNIRNAVIMNTHDYITFVDLDFRYYSNCVWEEGGNYLTWLRVDMSYIGGFDLGGAYSYRGGNGLQMWQGTSHDISITECNISNVYDAGISPQGYSGGFTVYNCYIRNNIISNCEYSYEFFERDGLSTAHDIYFENNTCINAGGSWAHSQRPDPNGSHVRMVLFTAARSNIFIRNNIFYGATERLVWLGSNSDITDMKFDYNDYYPTGNEYYGKINKVIYSSLAEWSIAIGEHESHSINGDPTFVTPVTDLHLQASSPCRDAGLDVGSGNDIGRYQY